MITRLLLQSVFLFLTFAAQAAVGGSFANENGSDQVIETTDSHPFWVVTDNPDLSRAAGEYVLENGTLLYHENLVVTGNGYYVAAKNLRAGDIFIGANGELTMLTATARIDYPDGITVYNFTVADTHNYFVVASLDAYQNGASVVLVHNAKCTFVSTFEKQLKTSDDIEVKVKNRDEASELFFRFFMEMGI
jgi:hypothetical protein